MSEGAPRWVVVCEARADRDVATELADRVIAEQLDWAGNILDSLRQWCGLEVGSEFTLWKTVKRLAVELGVRVHGKFGRGHQGGGEVEARKVLGVIAKEFSESTSAAILVRDTDGDVARCEGFQRAQRDDRWPCSVVLALPHPELEAWVLNGFEPYSPQEEANLVAERILLGFDPCEQAHDLNPGATNDSHGVPIKRSTKRIIDVLTGGDAARKGSCWTETSLDHLRERGASTGLAAYLIEVEKRLVPLVGEP